MGSIEFQPASFRNRNKEIIVTINRKTLIYIINILNDFDDKGNNVKFICIKHLQTVKNYINMYRCICIVVELRTSKYNVYTFHGKFHPSLIYNMKY